MGNHLSSRCISERTTSPRLFAEGHFCMAKWCFRYVIIAGATASENAAVVLVVGGRPSTVWAPRAGSLTL